MCGKSSWISRMSRIIKSIVANLLLIALAGCGALALPSRAPAGQPTAAATCVPVEAVQDSPDEALSLRSALEADQFQVLHIQASVHTSACQDPVTKQEGLQSIKAIDLAIDVAQDDLAGLGPIGIATDAILKTIEVVEPNLPGHVALRFVQDDSAVALSFTRDQARSAIQARQKNVDLLVALGYPPPATGSAPCALVWGKQPLPDLTQVLRDDFEKHGLAETTDVSAVKTGQWCGSDFSVRQTEFHIALGWLHVDNDQVSTIYGERTAAAFDRLLAIPKDQIPGDLSPRIVVLTGWDARLVLVTTLDEAKAMREAGLSGAALFDRAGFEFHQ
jgi:hypothetical protein